MKVYRILHKATGLYFCPSREVKVRLLEDDAWQAAGRYVKSNLSVRGKAYTRKPSLTFLGSTYYTHLILRANELNSHSGDNCVLPVVLSDWQIEEVTVQDAPTI